MSIKGSIGVKAAVMVFGGFQKLTLLDYPDKTACTLFTQGCNFACPFCQNSGLIKTDEHIEKQSTKTFNDKEILEFLNTRKGLLDGVCISGGEPLIHDELEKFIEEAKSLGFLIKLDTNGSDPVKLEKLIKSGKIDHIAMDIKNSPKKYPITIGEPEQKKPEQKKPIKFDILQIEKSIDLLLNGSICYEFRTTVVREFHTKKDLIDIAHWLSGASPGTTGTVKYYLQKFIDSENVLYKGLTSYSDRQMHVFISEIKTILPGAELRGIQ